MQNAIVTLTDLHNKLYDAPLLASLGINMVECKNNTDFENVLVVGNVYVLQGVVVGFGEILYRVGARNVANYWFSSKRFKRLLPNNIYN